MSRAREVDQNAARFAECPRLRSVTTHQRREAAYLLTQLLQLGLELATSWTSRLFHADMLQNHSSCSCANFSRSDGVNGYQKTNALSS